MADYLPVRDAWDFEAYYSLDPRAWFNEAINLHYSCELLIRYDMQLIQCIFEEKKEPPLPAFFTARVERMLMGFALENMIKAVLLQNPKKVKEVYAKDGNLSWGKDGHNLISLFKEAGIEVDDQEKELLELLASCAIWAGRYPIPRNEHGLPRQRKPVKSRGELIARRSKEIEKAIENHTPIKTDLFDKLHTGVGDKEYQCYKKLFDRLKSVLDIK